MILSCRHGCLGARFDCWVLYGFGDGSVSNWCKWHFSTFQFILTLILFKSDGRLLENQFKSWDTKFLRYRIKFLTHKRLLNVITRTLKGFGSIKITLYNTWIATLQVSQQARIWKVPKRENSKLLWHVSKALHHFIVLHLSLYSLLICIEFKKRLLWHF